MDSRAAYEIGPTIRRLEESPIFDYDRFIDDMVPSDTRMKILFPDDVEMRTNYRDALTEYRVLSMYKSSVEGSLEATKGDPHRDIFYEGLIYELEKEGKIVGGEFSVLHDCAPQNSLQMWEYDNLDQDGGTNVLEEDLRLGNDFLSGESPEVARAVIEKYGHLFTSEYWDVIHRRRLEYWEGIHLDKDGGMMGIQKIIAGRLGEKIFTRFYGGNEARAKYGYLLELPRDQLRLRLWEDYFLDHDGGTTKIQKKIARGRGEEIFNSDHHTGGEEARAKYGYLLEVFIQSIDKAAIDILESIRNLFPDTQPPATKRNSSTTDILESTRDLCRNSSPHRVKHDKPATDFFHSIRNLLLGTQPLAAKHDTSPSGISESTRDLIQATPAYSTTTKQEHAKCKHPPLTTISKSSILATVTLLAFLPLLVVELYLIHHAYIEWMTWYG